MVYLETITINKTTFNYGDKQKDVFNCALSNPIT